MILPCYIQAYVVHVRHPSLSPTNLPINQCILLRTARPYQPQRLSFTHVGVLNTSCCLHRRLDKWIQFRLPAIPPSATLNKASTCTHINMPACCCYAKPLYTCASPARSNTRLHACPGMRNHQHLKINSSNDNTARKSPSSYLAFSHHWGCSS